MIGGNEKCLVLGIRLRAQLSEVNPQPELHVNCQVPKKHLDQSANVDAATPHRLPGARACVLMFATAFVDRGKATQTEKQSIVELAK